MPSATSAPPNSGAQILAQLLSGMPAELNGTPLDEPYASLYGKLSNTKPGNRLETLQDELQRLGAPNEANRLWQEIISADPSNQAAEESAQTTGDARAERKLRFRTAANVGLEAEFRVNWVVPGYVAFESITELTGKPKAAGKTTMLLNLGNRITQGTTFLGQPCTKTPLLYLTEERPATFQEGLKRLPWGFQVGTGKLGEGERSARHPVGGFLREAEGLVRAVR